MSDSREATITVKSMIDFNIVGDNILDIAGFAVEKYEFRNETALSAKVRVEVLNRVREALWQRVEELKMRRQQILQGMFDLADETVRRVVDES